MAGQSRDTDPAGHALQLLSWWGLPWSLGLRCPLVLHLPRQPGHVWPGPQVEWGRGSSADSVPVPRGASTCTPAGFLPGSGICGQDWPHTAASCPVLGPSPGLRQTRGSCPGLSGTASCCDRPGEENALLPPRQEEALEGPGVGGPVPSLRGQTQAALVWGLPAPHGWLGGWSSGLWPAPGTRRAWVGRSGSWGGRERSDGLTVAWLGGPGRHWQGLCTPALRPTHLPSAGSGGCSKTGGSFMPLPALGLWPHLSDPGPGHLVGRQRPCAVPSFFLGHLGGPAL